MIPGKAAMSLYRGATSLVSPLAPALLRWRQRHGKEDAARLGERLGHASAPRPQGALVWLHGASVGEGLALLPVAERLQARGLSIVLTTGTVASADILATRLRNGAVHQYAPLDVARFVRRFLDHWRPDLVLIAESELWPNYLAEAKRFGAPVALVNARLSQRSFENWKRAPRAIQALLSHIDLTLAQTPDDAARLSALGAPRIHVAGNLKYDSPALPVDAAQMARLSAAIGSRPVWVAASTHDGEEEAALRVHVALRKRWPDLVTIVAPRHAVRGREIAALALAHGVDPRLRSQGELPDAGSGFYIADTMGEMGLFYRLAGVVFVGKSLAGEGGQNPIEPAKLGAAIVHGPNIGNFADVYRELHKAGGAIETEDAQALVAAVGDLIGDPAKARARARAAGEAVEQFGGAADAIMGAIEPYLSQAHLRRTTDQS